MTDPAPGSAPSSAPLPPTLADLMRRLETLESRFEKAEQAGSPKVDGLKAEIAALRGEILEARKHSSSNAIDPFWW